MSNISNGDAPEINPPTDKEIADFEYNKSIAIENNLYAGEIKTGQFDEWIGMVYFLDTSFSNIDEARHFAHSLDFINDTQRSENVLSELLNGEFCDSLTAEK